ncbi:MAG: hypothetical protein CL910_09925 [Deltaproteobacteria bacterium]|nr:hypothetical protein [Deltaproteobacteria bacterium]
MNSVRVVIVAQSPFSLTLMGDLLEANDIVTARARTPGEASALLESGNVDMIVVDFELGAGSPNGIDEMRRRADRLGIPMLVVAERGQREAAEQVLAGCSTGTVEKPIDTSAFPRKVIEEIRRHTTHNAEA